MREDKRLWRWASQAIELEEKNNPHWWSPQGQKLPGPFQGICHQVVHPYAFQEIGPVFPPRVLVAHPCLGWKWDRTWLGECMLVTFTLQDSLAMSFKYVWRPKHHLPLSPFISYTRNGSSVKHCDLCWAVSRWTTIGKEKPEWGGFQDWVLQRIVAGKPPKNIFLYVHLFLHFQRMSFFALSFYKCFILLFLPSFSFICLPSPCPSSSVSLESKPFSLVKTFC